MVELEVELHDRSCDLDSTHCQFETSQQYLYMMYIQSVAFGGGGGVLLMDVSSIHTVMS